MRNPGRILVLSLLALALGIALFRAALDGLTGSEDAPLTAIVGIAGLFVSLAAGWFVLVAAHKVRGIRKLRGGRGVVASWQVEPETWRRYLAIDLADSGVSLPHLEALAFRPRKTQPPGPVEVICGTDGALIDGCYHALSPGRGAGMEEAGITQTDPACLAFVIRSPYATSGSLRVIRTLLLLPVPDIALVEAHRALRHYLAAIAGVRGFDSVVAANNGVARIVFWIVLVASLVAAGLGIWLETIDYPGVWPDAMAITGIMVFPATLLLGWLWRPRSR